MRKITNLKLSVFFFFCALTAASITGVSEFFLKSAILSELLSVFFIGLSFVFLMLSPKGLKMKRFSFLEVFFWLLAAFTFLGGVKIIFSKQFYRFFGIYSYAVAFFSFLAGYQLALKKQKIFLSFCLFLSLAVFFNTLFSVLEYFLGPGFFLGATVNWPRTRGLFRGTLALSGFLGSAFFLASAFVRSRWPVVFQIIFFSVLLLGAFFTGSRMLMLIIAVVVLFVWPFFWFLLGKKKQHFYYLLVFAFSFLAVFIFKVDFSSFRQIATIFDFKDITNQLRLSAWLQGIDYLFFNPLVLVTGTGFGTSGSGMNYFGGDIIGTESYVLKTYIEMGFIMASLLWLGVLSLLIKTFFLSWKFFRKTKQKVFLLKAAAAVSLLIGLTQNVVQMSLETPSTSLWFWSLLGIMLASFQSSLPEKNKT